MSTHYLQCSLSYSLLLEAMENHLKIKVSIVFIHFILLVLFILFQLGFFVVGWIGVFLWVFWGGRVGEERDLKGS